MSLEVAEVNFLHCAASLCLAALIGSRGGGPPSGKWRHLRRPTPQEGAEWRFAHLTGSRPFKNAPGPLGRCVALRLRRTGRKRARKVGPASEHHARLRKTILAPLAGPRSSAHLHRRAQSCVALARLDRARRQVAGPRAQPLMEPTPSWLSPRRAARANQFPARSRARRPLVKLRGEGALAPRLRIAKWAQTAATLGAGRLAAGEQNWPTFAPHTQPGVRAPPLPLACVRSLATLLACCRQPRASAHLVPGARRRAPLRPIYNIRFAQARREAPA